jgi:NAD+ kinase
MPVLIVTKPTNLETIGDLVKSRIHEGRLSPNTLQDMQQAHDEHYRTLEELEQLLQGYAIEYYKVSRTKAWPNRGPFDAIFTVGGDGTLLAASHGVLSQTPLVGIRSSDSSVGYLCAADRRQLPQLIQSFTKQELKTLLCSRMVAEIDTGDDATDRVTYPVLNDFLFANVNPAATTRYELQWRGNREMQKSSGLWIATATGSSAGVHAAGGLVMGREDRRFQFRVRELYRGEGRDFALTHGFFDADQEPLVIVNYSGKAMLAMDGQRGAIHLRYGDRIVIRRGPDIRVASPLP